MYQYTAYIVFVLKDSFAIVTCIDFCLYYDRPVGMQIKALLIKSDTQVTVIKAVQDYS